MRKIIHIGIQSQMNGSSYQDTQNQRTYFTLSVFSIGHVITMKIKMKYWLMVFLACAVLQPVHALSIDKSLPEGKIRIHVPDQLGTQCTAILLGVGTAMSASGYDKLSNAINQHGHIVVILDHAPGKLMKTDAGKFAALAQRIKDDLLSWMSETPCNGIQHWIMGGHSAGGQAAQNAVANNTGLADGIFSIDPYNGKDTDRVSVPAMYWGFNKTTCFVTADDAAKETYKRSDDRRAFYQVNSKYSWGPCGYSPKYFHCSFCDGHCPACTNCKTTPDHFFVDVANSVDRFIQHGFSASWSHANMTFNSTTPYRLFMDHEQP